jgi:hypothetical protein
LNADLVIPWELQEWDTYVREHPAGCVYHTSLWCRIVSEIGGYQPLCLAVRDGGRLTGVLPAMEIRSRLTGNRMGSLPFSDECYAIADDPAAAGSLIEAALRLREERGLAFFEMRGAPIVRGGDGAALGNGGDALVEEQGFVAQHHFFNFLLALSPDIDSVMKTLHKKAVRPTIKRSFKLGVTVLRGKSDADIREFYRMYCMTRKRHGIPPQPIRMFERIMKDFADSPQARLYLAEFEGRSIGAVIVFRFRGKTYLKYEVVDDAFRDTRPVYAMLWKSIEESALDGDHTYDFGRTEKDNTGLVGFKSRWGTEQVDLPYYFFPPSEGLSVVKSSSLKYKLFTGVFRRMPTSMSVRIGERLFRHFG